MIRNKAFVFLRYDLKYNKPAILAVMAVYLALISCAAFYPSFFNCEIIDATRFKSNFFLYSDFILPFLFVVLFMGIFNRDFEKKTYSFLMTLPISRIQLFFFRFLAYFLVSAGLLFLFMKVSEPNIVRLLPAGFPVLPFMTNSFVNLWYMFCVSFFLIVLCKNDFASYFVFIGSVFFDFFTQAECLKDYSLFLNSFRSYLEPAAYCKNRFFLSAVGVVLLCSALFIINNRKIMRL